MRIAAVVTILVTASAAAGAGAVAYAVAANGTLPAGPAALAGLAAVAASILVGAVAAARLARPLRQVEEAARRVQEGDLTARADASLPGDAGDVARAFNEAVHAVEESQKRLQGLLTQEAELHTAAEVRLAGLSAVGPGHFWEWDPATAGVHASGRARTLYGFEADATQPIAQVEWSLAVHPEDRERLAALLRDAAGSLRRDGELDHRIRTPDSSWRWVTTRTTAARETGGRVLRVVANSVDLTERIRADETAADLKQRIAVAQRRTADFLGRVARALDARIDGLEKLRPAKARGKDRDLEDLRRFARNLQDHTHLETGALKLAPTSLHVSRLAGEAVDLVAHEAGSKGVELCYEVDAAVPDVIHADGERLRRVLENLLDNALRVTTTGEVVLSVATRARGTDRWDLLFWVKDSGPGIPPAELDRAFEPFNVHDVERGRLGLGLSVSRRLVEAMGGQVGVETSPGKGTTIHFSVPVDGVPSPRRETRDGGRGRLEGRHVLIVDDNATARRILGHTAEHWGMVPHLTSGAQAALEVLQGADPVDVVLVDQTLPRDDARILAQRVRDLPEGGGLPRILLVPRAANVDEKALGAAGLDAALAKPCSLEEFYDAVAGALDHVKFVGASIEVKASEPKRIEVPLEFRGGSKRIEVRTATLVPKKKPRKRAPKASQAAPTTTDGPSTEPARAPGVLDTAAVEKTRTQVGGASAFAAYVDTFFVHCEERLAELRGCVATGNVDGLADVVVRLAQESRRVGAVPFGAQCEELLMVAQAGDLNEATRRILVLESSYRNVKRALEVERLRAAA